LGLGRRRNEGRCEGMHERYPSVISEATACLVTRNIPLNGTSRTETRKSDSGHRSIGNKNSCSDECHNPASRNQDVLVPVIYTINKRLPVYFSFLIFTSVASLVLYAISIASRASSQSQDPKIQIISPCHLRDVGKERGCTEVDEGSARPG
jgi:hypothetical protein